MTKHMPRPNHLFVYGTLRSESLHPLARRLRAQAKLAGKASASGVLYDLGRYPGAAFPKDGRERVIGEMFALRNAERLLMQLDAYEEVGDPGAPLFKRIEIKVRLDRGDVADAWTYALQEVPSRARPIPSGDWIAHLRSRNPRAARR